jgi:hypothetical protein
VQLGHPAGVTGVCVGQRLAGQPFGVPDPGAEPVVERLPQRQVGETDQDQAAEQERTGVQGGEPEPDRRSQRMR